MQIISKYFSKLELFHLNKNINFYINQFMVEGAKYGGVGAGNIKLIETLQGKGIITHKNVAEVMKSVDRKDFVKGGADLGAYADCPQSISYGATISAPHMHAHALVYI